MSRNPFSRPAARVADLAINPGVSVASGNDRIPHHAVVALSVVALWLVGAHFLDGVVRTAVTMMNLWNDRVQVLVFVSIVCGIWALWIYGLYNRLNCLRCLTLISLGVG
jgi:hypothetical protein